MSQYRLTITFYDKDLQETDVHFDSILGSVEDVCKVLVSKCCKIKGYRERIKNIVDKETLVEELTACRYTYEIEKLS